MKRRYLPPVTIITLLILLSLGGCVGRVNAPEVTYLFDRQPTATTIPTATSTVIPSATASATPTATATATPLPTETPVPTPTPTPTREPSPTPWPTPDGPLSREERAVLFDELWRLVDERYVNENFNGVDWAAQREMRRPRALAAPGDEAFYQEIKEMVAELNDDHSRFMTPEEVDDHLSLTRNELTYPGFGLYTMPLPEGALVLQVIPDSPAEQAGIQACDRILTVDGRRFRGDRGEMGSRGTLLVERPGSGNFSVTLTRSEITQVLGVPGEIVPGPDRIGYVRIDTLWVRNTTEQLQATLAGLAAEGPLDGLILDLRTNLGGWRPVLRGILGTFTQGRLGEFNGRLHSDPLEATPPEAPGDYYPALPLAVLVSERTESYAEILAATLQAERDAIVIGQPTGGNVETIFPRRLPFGARVWIAEQGFRLNDGTNLNNVGVQPDIVDHQNWTHHPCARDPQVERAAGLLGR